MRLTAVLALMMVFCVLTSASVPLVNAVGDSWTTLEPMPTARSGLGVAVLDGKIYAIGGYNGSYLAVNEMYDPETNVWTTMASMPTARAAFAIAVCQNKIHVIGGTGTGDPLFSHDHEVYDPQTDTWETKGKREFGAYFCANVVNDKIYVIGGRLQWFPPCMARAQNVVYDPLTGAWTDLAPIPIAVESYTSTQ